MNPIIKSLFDRKSMRVYTDEPITPEEKALLFEAAFQAPTAGNQQMYTILDITDQKLKDELAELCDHQSFIATAPVVLIFLADCQKWQDAYAEAGAAAQPPEGAMALLSAADAVIAAQNVVVAAESMGIGSCYIGDVIENEEKMRALLNIPPYALPAAMLVMGRPTQQQLERPKPKRFDGKYVVFENGYHRLSGEELRDMFAQRAGERGFDAWVKALCERKNNSDFALEMRRSAKRWLEAFDRGNL